MQSVGRSSFGNPSARMNNEVYIRDRLSPCLWTGTGSDHASSLLFFKPLQKELAERRIDSNNDAKPRVGSCPGQGSCNGMGGSLMCQGCPTYYNMVHRVQRKRRNISENGHSSPTSSVIHGCDNIFLFTNRKACVMENNCRSLKHNSSAPINKNTQSDSIGSVVLECVNCKTKTTPIWRYDEAGNSICNACGLYKKLHGTQRPSHMHKSVIKRRKRIQASVTNQEHCSTSNLSALSTTPQSPHCLLRNHNKKPQSNVQNIRLMAAPFSATTATKCTASVHDADLQKTSRRQRRQQEAEWARAVNSNHAELQVQRNRVEKLISRTETLLCTAYQSGSFP